MTGFFFDRPNATRTQSENTEGLGFTRDEHSGGFGGAMAGVRRLRHLSTSLLAAHIRGESARLASIKYCREFEIVGLSFHALRKYARKSERLFTPHSDQNPAKSIDDQ